MEKIRVPTTCVCHWRVVGVDGHCCAINNGMGASCSGDADPKVSRLPGCQGTAGVSIHFLRCRLVDARVACGAWSNLRLVGTLAVPRLRASRRKWPGMRDQYSVSMVFSNLPSDVRFFSGSQVLCSSVKFFHLTKYMVVRAASAPGLNTMREYAVSTSYSG
jgi:hypothetical protein